MANYILSNTSLAVRVTLLLLHVQHVLCNKVMYIVYVANDPKLMPVQS